MPKDVHEVLVLRSHRWTNAYVPFAVENAPDSSTGTPFVPSSEIGAVAWPNASVVVSSAAYVGCVVVAQRTVRSLHMSAHTLRARTPTIADRADVIYARRAIRSYEADVVDEARIRALLDAAVHAPTAMHQEPWRFVVVQDRALLKRISDRAKEIVLDKAAHHGNLPKAPDAAHGVASLLADPAFNIFYDASTLIVIGAVPVNDFVAADCWLAAENLMLAACADGLGTCVIGFAVTALNAPDIKSELRIPQDVRVFAPIIVGVERGDAPPTPRKAAVVLNWIR